MSLRSFVFSALVWLALFVPGTANAGVARAAAVTDYEVIVFEMDGCTICGVFRRDVAQDYLASKRNETAPMRFQSLADSVRPHPGLQGPLSMLPTTVVMKGGREVARIEGYTGPEMFFQAMGRVFSTLPR